MLAAIGAALVISPFVGVWIYSVRMLGWKQTAVIYAIALAMAGVIFLGVALVRGVFGG